MAKIIKSLTALKPNGEVETLAVPWLEVDDILAQIADLYGIVRGGGEIIADDTGYGVAVYRFQNGLMIQTANSGTINSTTRVVNFPVAFTSAPVVQLTGLHGLNGPDGTFFPIGNVYVTTSTSFTIVAKLIVNTTICADAGNFGFGYTAIGFWK